MEFKKAYQKMLEGRRIARPCFKGYWYIDGVTNLLVIHLASGKDITKGLLDHTVKNVLAEDWYVL